MTINVDNLSDDVTQEELWSVFSVYGTVIEINLPTDRYGRLRGFAFVEMQSEAEEVAAIEALDGSEWRMRRFKSLSTDKRKQREEWINNKLK